MYGYFSFTSLARKLGNDLKAIKARLAHERHQKEIKVKQKSPKFYKVKGFNQKLKEEKVNTRKLRNRNKSRKYE